MRSTFTNRIVLPILLLVVVIASLVFVTIWAVPESTNDWIPLAVFYVGFLFIAAWLFFGEMRVRMIVVEVASEHLVVTSFLGLGKKRILYLFQLDGYETVVLPSRYNAYEYLFILRSGKRVVRLSAFYHSNYEELKAMIAPNLKYLGSDGFRVSKELRDMFG